MQIYILFLLINILIKVINTGLFNDQDQCLIIVYIFSSWLFVNNLSLNIIVIIINTQHNLWK